MKKILDTFLRAFATGIAIAIGGTAYLSCDNRYLGAFLFGTGLFVILSFGFDLFTGKVGYAVENKPSYIFSLTVIWLGNFTGTALSAFLVLNTRICCISEKAAAMCDTKLSDAPLSIFILAIFCGLLMFIAADGYKTISNSVGKILAVFLPVAVFILSGFEHCVANMFYFTLAEAWSGKALLWLLIMTLGNSVGGILIPILRKGFIKNEA
ncbi:formate/nitrite transporter family protein [Ruminococcus flavefaciens]|uniref:formate/nitrite transporter family protein n=1 Tax=Ruminococcus flavefaciens TaxID=1265 RepID=UPI00048BAFE7|nr:formate/nitrite transporter family protein [Ruminococcus flavefaciens]